MGPIQAATLTSRLRLRSSETTSVSRRYIDGSKIHVSEFDLHALEGAIVLRHREQMILEVRSLRALKLAQPLVVLRIDDYDRRLAVLGDGLRRPPGRFDHRAELVFGVLHRP